MPLFRPRTPPPILRSLVGLLVVVCSFLAATASPALADHDQVAILQDDSVLLSNPANMLGIARSLGASTMRVAVPWQKIAPEPNSFRSPRHFNAANPADYARSKWAPFDRLVRADSRYGVSLDLDLVGGAPLWATGRGMPSGSHGHSFHNWQPSSSAFGRFVHAIALRYSGDYDPATKRVDPGQAGDLPRVSFWSIWNEPNYGPSLAPQAVPHSASVPSSPRRYRALLDQAWSALRSTGHGSDTILFGELAPRGEFGYGTFNMMAPMIFLRALYCVNSRYHRLRGHSAAVLGCPTSSRGSAAFAARNPALFKASGIADHPYMRWYPPNREEAAGQPKGFHRLKPNYATLATIGNLERGSSRMLAAYHSRRRLPVWVTEFSYVTDPPYLPQPRSRTHYPYPATAAYFDNWAEYIAWRDPRLASFDQYELRDAPKPPGSPHRGFPSGLIFANGKYKPGYAAFRLPLYLPHTTASGPTHPLEVWGAARPAHFIEIDRPDVPESVDILFKRTGTAAFQSLAVEPISSAGGYFDTHLQFPASGTVELRWTYPMDSLMVAPGTTVYSRTVRVKVK